MLLCVFLMCLCLCGCSFVFVVGQFVVELVCTSKHVHYDCDDVLKTCDGLVMICDDLALRVQAGRPST